MNARSSGGGGRNASLTILFYHWVLPEPDRIFPTSFHAGMFGRQLDILKKYYRVLPLSEAIERLERGNLPGRSVRITFDDGYADNCTVALPMLVERGLHATFFVTTGFLNGGIMWNDVVRQCVKQADSLEPFKRYLKGGALSDATLTRSGMVAALLSRFKYEEPGIRGLLVEELAESLGTKIPTDLMLSSEQVRTLAASGMEVGAHTVTHPILSRIGLDQARQEIGESKMALEEILGGGVDFFAYPNGIPGKDFTEEHLRIVRDAGFSAAVTTSPGTVNEGMDHFQMPRYAPWSTSTGRYILNHWRNSRQTPRLLRY